MTITFEQAAQDFIAFSFYYHWSDPEKRKTRIIKSLTPLLFFILLLLFAKGLSFELYGRAEFILFLFGIFYAAIMSRLVKWNNARLVKKLIANGKNTDMIGTKTLYLEEDKLTAHSENSTTEIFWKAFEKVRETQDYFFLFIHVSQAIVVPKKALIKADQTSQFRNFIF